MENELRTGPAGTASLVTEDDLLARGIWPKSLALWMVAFYIALFIIRPWEQLLPWLAALRFERVYAIAMIVVAVHGAGIVAFHARRVRGNGELGLAVGR